MALIEQVYNLDLVPNGRPLVVNVSQYDQGSRALTFNFFKDNVAFTPPTGYAAHITGTKPDGTGFMYAMTVSGSAATVEVTQQMCAVAGDCPCEIRLIDGNSNVLGTANFTLAVERAAMDDDTVISESDIPYFEDLATQAAASAASAAASASSASALIPTGGTEGQVLTKTATGTAWEDAQGGATMVVSVTRSGSTYTADKTYAEIMAEINSGGIPVAKYATWVLPLASASSSLVSFGYFPTAIGVSAINITSSNAISIADNYIAPVRYYNKTLGSAEAVSDSTIYTNGYLLTITSGTVTNLTDVEVEFPNGDYSGNVTWITGDDHKILLYFDQNPNGKAIRVEWKTLTYTVVTVS